MNFRCWKCGSEREEIFTPDTIAELIKEPAIKLNCYNPQCKTFWGPTKIWITLGDVLLQIIKKTPPDFKATTAK
jgi:hypothetical protein